MPEKSKADVERLIKKSREEIAALQERIKKLVMKQGPQSPTKSKPDPKVPPTSQA
jgi:hypothetical protein